MKNTTQNQLCNALKTLTRLIDAYGDDYWPIFDRLEQELKQLQHRRSRLDGYRDNLVPINDPSNCSFTEPTIGEQNEGRI